MNILVTGAKGFIGRNLVAELKNRNYGTIYEYTRMSTQEEYELYLSSCDFVLHLLGVNRAEEDEAYMQGNYGEIRKLTEGLKRHKNRAGIVYLSSIQAVLNHPYGKSKKAAEEHLIAYGKENGVNVDIYRLPNVFGKWCKPNYNSVVATFCHHIARGMPITVHDSSAMIELLYIDDVVKMICEKIEDKSSTDRVNPIQNLHEQFSAEKVSLDYLTELLYQFHENREKQIISDLSDSFVRKLYSTYISYLPEDDFGRRVKANHDSRGLFMEVLKFKDSGQVSVNIIKPGMKKGDHWHHTKNEKFFVLSGNGLIHFRKVGEDKVIEYEVSADVPRVIDIPSGYIHSIKNLSETDMIVIIWADEVYQPQSPDTYRLPVVHEENEW